MKTAAYGDGWAAVNVFVRLSFEYFSKIVRDYFEYVREPRLVWVELNEALGATWDPLRDERTRSQSVAPHRSPLQVNLLSRETIRPDFSTRL